MVSGGFFYSLFVSLLKIGEAYPRRENKLTASTIKNIHPCSFFICEICISQISFLIRTIAIRGENDTLRIYCSSGMDAAGLNRSDVSAMLKLAAKSVQGCTLLARQRSRYTPPALLKIVIPDTRRRANNTRRRAFCTLRTVIRSATP